MKLEGVMVSYNHSGPEENANIITVSASGIKFSERWVITHGSILSPLAIANDIAKAKGKPIHNDQFYKNLPEMYITCEKSISDNTQNSLDQLEMLSRNRDGGSLQDLGHRSYQMRVLTGRICHLWQCPVLDSCVNEVLYSWTIGHIDGDSDKQTQLGKTLVSVFVLIDLGSDTASDNNPTRPLSELLDMTSESPDRGSKIQVHSTPFGCEVFLNSATRGWICGKVGTRPSLLLTDASTALGSEGSPVFTDENDQQRLIGMVICSVSWWRGEWVGLTLVAPLSTVLRTKLRINPAPSIGIKKNFAMQRILDKIDSTVVLVRCGEAWGTGVYLGSGYVLTCAHVVYSNSNKKLKVYCAGVEATAILKYKTEKEKAFDLALLFTNPDHWTHLTPAKFAMEMPYKGEPVVAIGYPYFNERNLTNLKPTITSGHVNNVSPSMIQTSCCVQSGFSGGAIFRLTSKTQQRSNRSKFQTFHEQTSENSNWELELVAIIVSNAKTESKDACYPFVNMSIPVHVFEKYLNDYLEKRDDDSLKNIESKKEIIQSQWKLHPYRSKI